MSKMNIITGRARDMFLAFVLILAYAASVPCRIEEEREGD